MTDQRKYTNKLSGARILIIGGSSGIGFAVAEASLEHGAGSVIISSSRQNKVDEAVSRLRKAYPSAPADAIKGLACNLGDEASLESNVKALFEKTGELDHIVMTAGDSLATKSIQDEGYNYAFLKQAGMVRYFGAILVAKYGYPHLSPGPGSSIILTTGSVAEKPTPGWSAISGFAAGLHGATRGLALDLKPIRVNLISPGPVNTEMWDSNLTPEVKEKLFESLKEGTATGAAGRPEDLAEAYLYLMKDKNITGRVVCSDSGALLV